MPEVIILANQTGDGEHVAYYLRSAFAAQNLEIYLYNYTNGSLHRWNNNADLALVGFNNQGARDQGSLHRTMRGIVGTDGAADSTTSQALRRFHKKVGTPGGGEINVVDYSEFSSRWLTKDAKDVIDDLMGRNGEDKCFVICPNVRNLPPQFLSFAHKLDYDQGVLTYTKKHGGTFAVDHLNMSKEHVACAMTELALCNAILDTADARYLGNCYGSQVMWVALGGGLTTYKRNSGVQHNNTAVFDTLGSVANVDWDDIYLADDNGVAATNTLDSTDMIALFDPGYADYGLQGRIAQAAQGGFSYNTDFHHGFMLVASNTTQTEVDSASMGMLAHPIAANVPGGNPPQDHLRRFKRYAGDSPKYQWIGMYGYKGRVFGFQGHPLYHLTQDSVAWDGNLASEDGRTQNALYQNNKRLMWNCLFDNGWN